MTMYLLIHKDFQSHFLNKVIEHPPYSSNNVMCDIWILLIEKGICGCCSPSENEIVPAINILLSIPRNSLLEEFNFSKIRLLEYIDFGGSYFEHS